MLCSLELFLVQNFKIIPDKQKDSFFFLKNYLEFKFHRNLLRKKKKIGKKKIFKKSYDIFFFNMYKKFNKYLHETNNISGYFFLIYKFDYYQKTSKIKKYLKKKSSFWLQIQIFFRKKKYYKINILNINSLTVFYLLIDSFFEIFELLFSLDSIKNRNKILIDNKKINKILNFKNFFFFLNLNVFRTLIYDYCIINYQGENTTICWQNYLYDKSHFKKKKQNLKQHN
nr:hypothetical protein Cry52Nrm1_p163 [Cryptomonas curvata]